MTDQVSRCVAVLDEQLNVHHEEKFSRQVPWRSKYGFLGGWAWGRGLGTVMSTVSRLPVLLGYRGLLVYARRFPPRREAGDV